MAERQPQVAHTASASWSRRRPPVEPTRRAREGRSRLTGVGASTGDAAVEQGATKQGSRLCMRGVARVEGARRRSGRSGSDWRCRIEACSTGGSCECRASQCSSTRSIGGERRARGTDRERGELWDDSVGEHSSRPHARPGACSRSASPEVGGRRRRPHDAAVELAHQVEVTGRRTRRRRRSSRARREAISWWERCRTARGSDSKARLGGGASVSRPSRSSRPHGALLLHPSPRLHRCAWRATRCTSA